MLLLLFSLMVHAREIVPGFDKSILNTGAVPVEIVQGQFRSHGLYQLQSHQRSEEVEVQTAEGQRRLDELLTEGYQCVSKTEEKTVCLKALQVAGGVPPGLPEAVQEKWQNQTFSFEQVVGEPELVTNTEFYKQWRVPQKAVLWEIPDELEKHVWNPLTYVWTQGDWQVHLGQAMSGPYFAMKIENQKLKMSDKIEIQKASVLDRYFVEILFERTKRE